MDENVQVKFGGNTAELDVASQNAKRDIGEVGKAAGGLSTVFRNLAGVTRNSFGGAMFAELKSHISSVTAEAKEAGAEVLGLKEIFGMAFGGIVAALSVPALLEFGEHMGEMVEKTSQQAQQLGISATTISAWGGVMKLAGMDTDGFTRSARLLERNLALAASGSKTQAAAFKALGINAKTATDPQKALLQIADKFKDMPDGPRKTALAMQLMGRSGAQMIPILNQGSEGIKEQMKVADEYGATMDDAFIQKGLRVSEAFNEQKLGAQGLKNVLFDEFAPTIATIVEWMNEMVKGFVQSYREGGTVAVVLGAVSVAIKAVINDIMVLKLGFTELWDVAQIILGSLIGAVWTLGQTIWDALHGRFQQAAADFKGSMSDVADFVKQKSQEILDAQSKTVASVTKLWAGTDGKNHKPRAEGGSDSNEIPGLGGKQHDNAVQQWEADLQRKLMAEKNFFGDSKAEELAFWQAKLALTAAGSKDQAAVQSKVFQLTKAIAQDKYRADMEDFDYKKQLAKDDFATQVQIETDKVAEVKRLYGEDSREYTKVLREKAQLERAYAQDVVKIETQRIQTQASIEEEAVSSAKAILNTDMQARQQHVDALAQMGKLSDSKALAQKQTLQQQELATERSFENKMFQLKASAIQEELALANLEPTKRRELNDQLLILQKQHNDQLQQLDVRRNSLTIQQADQTALQVEQKWKNALTPVTDAFNNAFNAIFVRTKTVGQAIKGVFTDLGQHMIKVATDAAGKWIAKELAKAAIHKSIAATNVAVDATTDAAKMATQATTGVAQVLSNAAIAASAAFASTAAIPIVGPALAPEAAAAAYAATSAFAPLASASQGFDIPSGTNPLTQLHEEEMVLPSNLANPIRDMIRMANVRGGGLSGSAREAGSAARDQTNNSSSSPTFNYQPQHTHQPAGLEDILQRDGASMRKWFRNEVRNGSLGLPSGSKR